MSTSYADSAQAREWDRRFDDYGRPKVLADLFHDYDAIDARSIEREAIRLAERKAAQVRINAAIDALSNRFGLNGNVSNSPLHGTFDVQGVNMNATTELATVPPKETALAVYSAANGLDPWLKQIRGEVDKFLSVLPELTTKKGRDRYASMAHTIAKSKTALDAVGKELSAQQKEVPKRIDAERKRVWDTLELWQKEVRKPLDDWQAAEDARVDKLQNGIDWFNLRATENADLDSTELKASIAEVERIVVGEKWEEFEAEAHRSKSKAIESLNAALVKREAYEAEQAELAKLRADAEAQAQRDREAQIARDAEERAKAEAERAAQAEREAVARREQEGHAAFAQDVGHREALMAVEIDVEQREIDVEAARQSQRLVEMGRDRHDLAAQLAQHVLEQHADDDLVLDDQDAPAAHDRPPSSRIASSGASMVQTTPAGRKSMRTSP